MVGFLGQRKHRPRGNGKDQPAAKGRVNGLFSLFRYEVNRDKGQNDRYPESTETEQSDQDSGEIGTDRPEKILNFFGWKTDHAHIIRMMGDQADEGENDDEKWSGYW